MNANFPAALDFVWLPQNDSPDQGVHTTPGDSGGTTFGGVIQATWDKAVRAGIVKGSLEEAGRDQLSTVLRTMFWGITCDDLPNGLDFLLFNGRMMSGAYPKLVQQCLGFMGPDDVDGWIGPESLAAVKASDGATLIHAVSGAHAAYLSTLTAWARFGNGWTIRVKAAQSTALAMAEAVPVA